MNHQTCTLTPKSQEQESRDRYDSQPVTGKQIVCSRNSQTLEAIIPQSIAALDTTYISK